MTLIDYQLEKYFQNVAKRPPKKFEETLTTFDRNIFWYNRDEIQRQYQNTPLKTTYEDHRKAIEVSVNMMGKTTQHEIAMCILTHRYFSNYRNSVFTGTGDFYQDYSFLVKKISMVFNSNSSRIIHTNINTKLKEFIEPTLVQVNHISGDVTKVALPKTIETLNEWAIKFNENACESTTYHVAGLKLGA